MKGILLFLAGVLVGANAVLFLLVGKNHAPPTQAAAGLPSASATSAASTAAATTGIPTSSSSATDAAPAASAPPQVANPPTLPPTPTPNPATLKLPPPETVPTGTLLLPVAGVTPAQLSNTFDDTRGSDRQHEALDIMAPRGTPVLAVADGRVEKLFDSKQGGLTMYQFDRTEAFAYYYAHLDRYAPGMVEGRQLERGEVLGYVGSTGNADPDGPHLHFAIFVLGPEKHWWQGTAINPYPLVGGR